MIMSGTKEYGRGGRGRERAQLGSTRFSPSPFLLPFSGFRSLSLVLIESTLNEGVKLLQSEVMIGMTRKGVRRWERWD